MWMCLSAGSDARHGYAGKPGGLTWLALTRLLRRVCRAGRSVVAADLVETALPGQQVSEYTAARLAAKLLAYHKCEGRKPGRLEL